MAPFFAPSCTRRDAAKRFTPATIVGVCNKYASGNLMELICVKNLLFIAASSF